MVVVMGGAVGVDVKRGVICPLEGQIDSNIRKKKAKNMQRGRMMLCAQREC